MPSEEPDEVGGGEEEGEEREGRQGCHTGRNCVFKSQTFVVSGLRPVKNDERVGLQMACCTYARLKTTVPAEAANLSRCGVIALPPYLICHVISMVARNSACTPTPASRGRGDGLACPHHHPLSVQHSLRAPHITHRTPHHI